MRLYLVWERVIKQQQNILLMHRLAGMRTTPVYELREGKGSGESIHQAERIAIDIEFAENKIAAGLDYRANLEEIIRLVAGGDADKLTFIRRYWWTGGTSLTRRARIMLVLDALPFLAKKEWGTGQITKANDNFYKWRDKVYDGLGELLGYR